MIAAALDHLWQSTLFAGGAAILAMALRGNEARFRFALWFAASLKFLFPFSLLVMLASRLILPFTAPVTTSSTIYAVQEAAQPFAVAVPSVFSPVAAAKADLAPFVITLWALGFAAVLFIWFRRWRQIQTVLRAAVTLPVTAPLPVKASPSLLEPGLVGVWRPVLLLPQGIAARLTQSEMDAILAHELCHFRRRDNLTAAIHGIVEALFWFYPLTWWIGARMVAEREQACDESVLSAGNAPDTYAEAILKVCRFYVHAPCAAGISGADLRTRIETIMAARFIFRLNPVQKMLVGACAAAVLAAPLLMGLSAPPMVPTVLPQVETQNPGLAADEALRFQPMAMRAAAFDRFAGDYNIAPFPMVYSVWRKDNHFFMGGRGLAASEIHPQSSTEFYSADFRGRVQFESGADGHVTAMVIHQGRIITRMPRIGAAAAQKLEAALQQRIDSGRPSPGTEGSLRRYILSLEAGRPNYQEMMPGLAANVRAELPDILARVKNWGAFQSIAFKSVDGTGRDVYEVRFANGSAQWHIGALGPDGKVQNRSALAQIPFHFGGALLD